MKPGHILDRCQLIIGLVCLFLVIGCSENEKLSIHVAEGFASITLKEFARQAQVEIIYDPDSIHEVKTNAVEGEYDPKSALRILLEDTPLSFIYDNESGAYAIIRSKALVGKPGTHLSFTLPRLNSTKLSVKTN